MPYIPSDPRSFGEFDQAPEPAVVRPNASRLIAIISFILGGLTLAVAWIPYLGMLAIPVALAGAALGFAGIIVGRVAGQRRAFLPFLAMLLCGVSIAVSYGSTYAWQHRDGAPGQGSSNSAPPPPAVDMRGVSGPFVPTLTTQPTFVMPRIIRPTTEPMRDVER